MEVRTQEKYNAAQKEEQSAVGIILMVVGIHIHS